MTDWDRIRIVGDGTKEGRGTQVLRNGVPIPGLIRYTLSQSVDGAVELVATQRVILEDHADLVEEATQALEEREQAWQEQHLDIARVEERAVCRSCGAPIIWAVTATGKRMPVDFETGVSHFATCPQAASWRKPRADAAPLG